MASGKSTVGPLVADALGYRFLDLDWLVVVRTGRSIPEIFASGGAGAFRAAEREALEETARAERHVIATGGGSLVQARAMEIARAAGPVVWLRTRPETAARRVGSAGDRPMLWGDDGRPLQGAALRQRIQELMAKREAAYARADLAVDADGPPEAVARAVVEALRASGGG
jgi:shikimate kinase